jgi:hypothetical protein
MVPFQDKVELSTTYYFSPALCGDAGWTALGATGITCFADMSEFGRFIGYARVLEY